MDKKKSTLKENVEELHKAIDVFMQSVKTSLGKIMIPIVEWLSKMLKYKNL